MSVYYSDSSIRITDKEIVIPKRTLEIADVKSTSLKSVPIGSTEWQRWQFAFIWSVFHVARGSFGQPDFWRFDIPLAEVGRPVYIGAGYSFLFLIIGVRAFLAYRAFFRITGQVYVAKIAGTFGRVVIAAAIRREQIQKVLDAINVASIRGNWGEDSFADEAAIKPDIVPYTEESLGQIQRMFWLDGKVYHTDEIKSFGKVSTPGDWRLTFYYLVSDAVTLCALFVLVAARTHWNNDFWEGLLVLSVLAAPALLLAFLVDRLKLPNIYLVKLKMVTGTVYAFASLDEVRVQNIIDIISVNRPYGPGSGYIADSEVQVDDAKARFGKKIYAIEDIRAVDVQVIRSNRHELLWLGVLAIIVAVALIVLDFYFSIEGGHWLALLSVPLLALPGVALVVISNKTTYTLILQGRFGEVQAFKSHSELYVQKIAGVLKGLLMQRREAPEIQG